MIEARVSPTRIPAKEATELEICLTNNGHGICTSLVFRIKLPSGIMRLHGRERIERDSLGPGRSVTLPLRIRAENAGRYELTSANFSYRDHRGQPHRERGFATTITVDPEREPPPEPQVRVELQTAELPFDEWASLRGRIVNSGPVDISNLACRLSGQVAVDQRGVQVQLEQLPAGRSADVSFFVHARLAGAHVPVHLDLSYSDQARRYHIATTRSVKVTSGPVLSPPAALGARRLPVKILFLGANPLETRPLRLDEEMREIQRTIQAGKERDNLEFHSRTAVRPADISQALLDIAPRVVHFAGHGGGVDGSFAAEDEYGRAHVIPVAGLVQVFRSAGRNVECVLVNACSTELLARAMTAVATYVIGMRHPVGDRSAIRFSIGFYQALAAGRPVEDAFDLGVGQLMMMPEGTDQLAPVLFHHGAEG
jgi:hypothetical protein